jgi:hypothetical protein
MSLHGLHYFLALVVVAHRHQWPDKRCCKALPAYHPSKLTKMNKDPPMPKDLHRQLFFSPTLQLMHTVREDHFVIFGLTCHILELKRLEVSSIVPYYRFPSYHGLLLPADFPIELQAYHAKSTFLKQKLSRLSRPDHLRFKAVRDDRLCRVLPPTILATIRQLSLDRTEASDNTLISPNCHTT